MLYENTPSHVQYKKESTGDVESKFIIPVRIPSDNVTVIDIDGLSEAEIDKLVRNQREYSAYLKTMYSNVFKFEDWVEHTTGERPTVKWRTYKAANILKSD